jgi:hypothetical protein
MMPCAVLTGVLCYTNAVCTAVCTANGAVQPRSTEAPRLQGTPSMGGSTFITTRLATPINSKFAALIMIG